MIAKTWLLVVSWLVFAGVAYSESIPPVRQDAGAILAEVSSKGASAVVRNVFGKPAWEEILKNIASGESAWIDVALALRSGTDAGSTSELQSAMFLALGRNPTYVLLKVEPRSSAKARSEPESARSLALERKGTYVPLKAEPQFSLSDVCGVQVDLPSTYQAALAEFTRTRMAVEAVQGTDLQSKKNLCLAELKEGEGHVKRFFEVK